MSKSATTPQHFYIKNTDIQTNVVFIPLFIVVSVVRIQYKIQT